MSAKQKILHDRRPSNLNLGIFVCSWWHSSPTVYSANDKSKKENTFGGYLRLFAWVLRAFLTKHWIHTRAECDFAKSRFLCVQCPLKIPLRSNSLRSTERKLFYPSIPVIMRRTKDMVGYASGSKCSLIFYITLFFFTIGTKQKGLQYHITILQ